MFNYAFMLKCGDGIPIDKKEAAKYLKDASDKGNVNTIKALDINMNKI